MVLKTVHQHGKILIVDDEKANVRFLEIILQQAGYANVYSTTDSRQTRSLFQDIQPDIVLLDLSMPHLDGFGVMAQLQPEMMENPVPILVLTADASLSTKHKALKQGANDFLTKPLDEIEVLLRINNLLETRFHSVLLESRVRERTHDLAESRELLRALAGGLTLMREAERTEMAREVHDELGQALTSLKMDVAWLDKKIATGEFQREQLQSKIKAMYDCIDGTIRSVQQIATRLRPGILDDLGLEAAIEWQAQEFQERTGIRCECVSSLGDMALPSQQSTTAFRILQESLTNIVRHAAADRVCILLEENNHCLILEVQDNGRGFNGGEISSVKSLGLLGMRERALLVGGKVEIIGKAGKGTTVTVRIPLGQEYSHE